MHCVVFLLSVPGPAIRTFKGSQQMPQYLGISKQPEDQPKTQEKKRGAHENLYQEISVVLGIII
jgi:hypothetical protein